MVILDTNALIFDALEPSRLSPSAAAAIDAGSAAKALSVCDISLWEVAMLIERGRVEVAADAKTFLGATLASRGIRVLGISPAIAALSASIPLHGDPADRLIAASAIVNGAPLVTSDRRLRDSPLVTTIW